MNEQALEVLNKAAEETPTDPVKKPKKVVPRHVQRHKALCKQIHDTYVKKNSDYGSSFHTSIREFGLSAAGVRISDKYNRIITLLKNNKPQVTNESLTDSLLDLANYCLMTAMELEGKTNE